MNRVGANAGDPSYTVALDEGSLLDAARDATGLDDFGDDGWREPFGLLLEGLNTTARLHAVGRMLARADIVRSLVNRLEVTAAFDALPALAESTVDAPIFVTGLARSGTSILHELLAQDPALRAPLTWELLYPRADAEPGDRPARANADVTFWNLVTPEYRTMHENRGDAPNECILGTMSAFAADYWSGGHDVPDYARWLARSDMSLSYRFHRQLLQVLQGSTPDRPWTLKAPSHLSSLPALFAEYPDARVVITHRDPLRVLGSLVDLLVTLRWQRSDHVDYERIVRTNVKAYPYVLDAMIDQRESGAIPEAQIVDVQYQDLVQDPWKTLHGAYDRLGLAFAPAAETRMRAYLAAKPKDRHGVHQYAFADLGVDRDDTRAAFARYQHHFGVPDEQ
jgi:hypothetical protein